MSSQEYGTVPVPHKRPSARNLLAIIDSKKNFRGVSKAFDSLAQEATQDLISARNAVPLPAHPYTHLLRLPRVVKALRFLGSRKGWHAKKIVWAIWMDLLAAAWARDEHYMVCVIRLQKWCRHGIARRRILFLQHGDNEEAVGADGSKVDSVSAFAISSVKMIRSLHAIQIQCCVRSWLAGFTIRRQVWIKFDHVNNKSAKRIQRIFRGYFCRCTFILREKSLLLSQLRQWAHGSTQKLLLQEDLSAAEHQQLILSGIYLAALSSRPLRNLPTLASIKHMRYRLHMLQLTVETIHTTLRKEYMAMRREREEMFAHDLQGAYSRNYAKLLAAKSAAKFQEAQKEQTRLQDEQLKLKQRKIAMSVMAHYSLDQNNQRVERENMFREEHLTRCYMQEKQRRAQVVLQTDRAKMLHEDYLSLQMHEAVMKASMAATALQTNAAAVKAAKLSSAGTGVIDRFGSNIVFGSMLPWWAQREDTRTNEQKRVDNMKILLHEALPEVKIISSPKLMKEKVKGVGSYTGAQANSTTEFHSFSHHQHLPLPVLGTISHSSLTGNTTLSCFPVLPDGALSKRNHLANLRCRRRDRIRLYEAMQDRRQIFCNKHDTLCNTRRRLLTEKFPSRSAKKACQSLATEQELVLPAARAEVLRYARALRRAYQLEMEAFVTVFLPVVPDDSPASTSVSKGGDGGVAAVGKKDQKKKPPSPTKPSFRSKFKATDKIKTPALNTTKVYTDRVAADALAAAKKEVMSEMVNKCVPLTDVLDGNVNINRHGRWAQVGTEDSSIQDILHNEEVERRRAFWGFTSSEACRKGKLTGDEAEQFAAEPLSVSGGNERSTGKGSGSSVSFAMPPAYPVETSQQTGDSIFGSTTRVVHKLAKGFVSSNLRSKAGASLADTFGLDFDDSEGDSTAGGSLGTKSTKSGSATGGVMGRRNTSKSSKRREKAEKEALIAREKERANRKKTVVPGFAYYTAEFAREYDFIQWVENIRIWCVHVDTWMYNVEEKWRSNNRASLISDLQRLQWLETCSISDLSCKNILSPSGLSDRGDMSPLSDKYDVLNSNTVLQEAKYGKSHIHVAHAAATVSKQDALDLYELSLCRVDWHLCMHTPPTGTTITANNNVSNITAANTSSTGKASAFYRLCITSKQAETLFGHHPFSQIAMFFLQNRLTGGEMKDLNKQANTTRAGMIATWTQKLTLKGLKAETSLANSMEQKIKNKLVGAARRVALQGVKVHASQPTQPKATSSTTGTGTSRSSVTTLSGSGKARPNSRQSTLPSFDESEHEQEQDLCEVEGDGVQGNSVPRYWGSDHDSESTSSPRLMTASPLQMQFDADADAEDREKRDLSASPDSDSIKSFSPMSTSVSMTANPTPLTLPPLIRPPPIRVTNNKNENPDITNDNNNDNEYDNPTDAEIDAESHPSSNPTIGASISISTTENSNDNVNVFSDTAAKAVLAYMATDTATVADTNIIGIGNDGDKNELINFSSIADLPTKTQTHTSKSPSQGPDIGTVASTNASASVLSPSNIPVVVAGGASRRSSSSNSMIPKPLASNKLSASGSVSPGGQNQRSSNTSVKPLTPTSGISASGTGSRPTSSSSSTSTTATTPVSAAALLKNRLSMSLGKVDSKSILDDDSRIARVQQKKRKKMAAAAEVRARLPVDLADIHSYVDGPSAFLFPFHEQKTMLNALLEERKQMTDVLIQLLNRGLLELKCPPPLTVIGASTPVAQEEVEDEEAAGSIDAKSVSQPTQWQGYVAPVCVPAAAGSVESPYLDGLGLSHSASAAATAASLSPLLAANTGLPASSSKVRRQNAAVVIQKRGPGSGSSSGADAAMQQIALTSPLNGTCTNTMSGSSSSTNIVSSPSSNGGGGRGRRQSSIIPNASASVSASTGELSDKTSSVKNVKGSASSTRRPTVSPKSRGLGESDKLSDFSRQESFKAEGLSSPVSSTAATVSVRVPASTSTPAVISEDSEEYGMCLHTKKCSGALFVKTIVNQEHWEVRVSRWLRPVVHWGTEAGPEPFWRRLILEKLSGQGGKFTRANEKDKTIDTYAKELVRILKLRQRTAAVAKEHILEPIVMQVEGDCMHYEDARSVALRKKRRVEEYDAEMKDQERALKMQSSSTSLSSSGKFNPSPVNASSPMKRVTSPTSPNKPSGSPSGSPTKEWKVKNRTARLQKWELAAPEPEVTSSFFACLDFSKIFPSLYDLDAWYEKRLQRLPRSQWEIIVTRRKGVELAVPRGNSERENVYRRAHAEAKLVADREHTHYEAFLVGLVNHKATPNMRTLFQQALDHELTRHPAMLYQHVQLNSVSNSQCKAPILLAKEGLITSKPYHGVHGNAQKAEITSLYDFITKESKKWSRRTSWVTGDAVNIGEDGEHRTLTHAATTKKGRGRKVANKYHVTAEFPEVWTCGGGVHGVVCIMRVQDQIERIPRGSPVVECITGLGAVSLRCGFQNKLLLCDNDHNLFATHVCKRITSKETRFLSVDAGYKLRHSDIPLRELPTADQFYPIVMQTLFASRHDHGASRGYVVRIQGLYHFKAARNRIKYLKMAIDERLALDREMKRLEEEAVREEEEDDINDSELRNAMFDACIPHEDKEYSKQQLQLHSTTIHASTPVVGSELEVHNSEYLSHSHPGPNPRVIKLSQFSTSPASESLSEAEFQVEIQHANHQDEETDLEKRAVQTQRLTSLNL